MHSPIIMYATLIDPPVNPLSPPAAILGWLAELAELEKRHSDDMVAIERIHDAVKQAEWFLHLAESQQDLRWRLRGGSD
jgi:hypothetical protein